MNNFANSGLKLLPGTDVIQKYYIDKLGSRFWISSLIPSILFLLSLLLITFMPSLSLSNLILYIQRIPDLQSLIFSLIVLFVVSFLIGLWLYAFQSENIQIYSGDTVFRKIPLFTKFQKKKASGYIAKIGDLEKRIRTLQKTKKRDKKTELQLDLLRDSHYPIVAEYDRHFPQSPDDIMPTRFGNILKATQWYSADRYGMDPQIFWSRLLHVIPPSYKEMLEDGIDQLMFFVNLSFLFNFLGVISIIYGLVNSGDLVLRYVATGTFAFLIAIVFYNSSLRSLLTYGELMRSSYDLFRLQLLEQFNMKPPVDSAEEYDLWLNLGELILLGRLSVVFKRLEYQVHKGKNDDGNDLS